MTTYDAGQIKDAVRAHCGGRAEEVLAGASSSSCCGAGATDHTRALYGAVAITDLPESAVSYGCGNPTALAGLRAGETVLDLGSGAGLDCFIAARMVGASGRVIGLDMTDAMLALANANRAKLGFETVEFRKGEMEAMPLPDAAVDVNISNCVINLSPDKDAVFGESFRVLRPGGRLHDSDVVLSRSLSPEEQGDLATWAGCASGALLVDDYRARLEVAGFAGVSIAQTAASAQPWHSALITAYRRTANGAVVRPAASEPNARISFQTDIPLEVVAARPVARTTQPPAARDE